MVASRIPTRVRLKREFGLEIEWPDGFVGRLPAKLLRDHCPCATCQQQAGHGPSGATQLPIFRPTPRLVEVKPVGNYALQLFWSDGHNTGIYTYEHLRQLSELVLQEKNTHRLPS